ncbi:MAG: dihydropteroate synthase [Candidatus Zixiibacteriota bacterium]
MSILFESKKFEINFGKRKLDLCSHTHLMGVLNVTPDSFSDGGKFLNPQDAVEQALIMAEQGADIIDVGGESTRPGAETIPVDEEIRRVIPVIKEIVKKTDIPISIDTYKSEVATQALDAGAVMINDISALRFDPEMKKIASRYGVPVVLMHIQGTPRNMQDNPFYDNLIQEISDYLKESVELAENSGIDEEKIIIDPGIGFGKRLEDNLEILKKLNKLNSLGKPILVGLSRKSFIGKVLDLPLGERLEGSLAALAVAIQNGAKILRVHDVKESKRAARMVDAILQG